MSHGERANPEDLKDEEPRKTAKKKAIIELDRNFNRSVKRRHY
jgi:hypothetical protein